MKAMTELKSELRAISDLTAAAMVLEWDQNTYMPPGGAEARGRQIALLSRLAHERRAGDRMGELLGELSKLGDAESVEGALVRRAHWEWKRATRVPSALMEELQEHGSRLYAAWTKARKQSDFAMVQPLLEKNLELSRRYADHFDVDHPVDAFVDEHDPGMAVASIKALFADLREELVPIAEKLLAAEPPQRRILDADYPEEKQLAFAAEVSAVLGYDFERGRQDLTHHPFMIRFSTDDVRITTRVDPRDFTDCLFGTIHETGHALYEQNIDPTFDGTPLGAGASTGVHESQSRLWENQVARSRPFWDHFMPRLREVFPDVLGDTSVEELHRAINNVAAGMVRVDADEVTYNLHVMLRFDLECRMHEGDLKVADLPEAWNERMESDLGVKPPTDALGCLQDVHWYCMPIGGTFQGYALGNLMSAQFYAAARKALPELDAQIASGEFGPLRGWLTENVYRHGAQYWPDELVEKATGKPLGTEDFLAHLRTKYGALYGVDLS
jgi:carboxypeptidase Taq